MGSGTGLRRKHFQDMSQYSKSDQDRKLFDRKFNVPGEREERGGEFGGCAGVGAKEVPRGRAEGGDVDVEEDGEGDLGSAAGVAEGEDVEAEVEAVTGVMVPGGGHGFEGVGFWWGGVVSFWVVIGMLDG